MSPPFISEYKKYFAVKRICQTFLGPRLFTHPVSITVQITLFTLPAILLSIVHLVDDYPQDLYWTCIVVGVSCILLDVFFNFTLILLKKGHHNVAPSESLHNFLAEEDQNDYEGFFKSSTWIFIAPNASVVYIQMISIFFSSLSFAFCTPLVFDPQRSPVLRGLGIFTLCIGRYSAVISQPPEVANFDPIKRIVIKLYRSFYTNLIGVAYHGALLVAERRSDVNTFYFLSALSLMPILWVIGILPPLDALFPWLFETIIRCFGGNPSFYYFGTVLTMIAGVIGTILAFVAAKQNPILLVVIECIFGYVMSSDIGAILNVRTTLCEDIPAKTALIRLLKPVLAILTSVCFIILTMVTKMNTYPHEGLIAATMTIAFSSWIIRQYLIGRKQNAPKAVILLYGIWDGILMFVLQVWIVLELNLEEMQRSLTVHSLTHLFDYMFTIRAFAQTVCSPKMTALDLTLTTFYRNSSWRNSFPQTNFVITLFLVSMLRSRVIRFIQFFRYIMVISHAFLMSPLLESKWKIALVGLLAYPISITSLFVATIIEGCTLVPIFTLPIFLVGFPRPASFWKAKWFPKTESSKQITGIDTDGKSLDWTIYAQIAPVLTRNFIRKAYKARMRLEEGNCFIARYEDRLVFLRIVSSGWNFIYINVKGLEMQEQTSCHHQEAAWIDEYFEKAFGSSSIFRGYTIRSLLFSSVQPQLPLMVSTYAESKSTLNNLKSKEELQVFQNMFFRAFSYLWIKKNPVFKGESYQRPIASGYHFFPPGGSSVIIADENGGSFDDDNSDDDEMDQYNRGSHGFSNHRGPQSNTFSMSKALFNCTMMNVNAIQGNSFAGGTSPNTLISPHTLISPMPTIVPNRDSWNTGFNNGFSFPFLPGMDTGLGPRIMDEEESFINNNMSRFTMSRQSNLNNFVSESGKNTPDPSEGQSQSSNSSWTGLNPLWVKKCVGETIPSNAVKIRVEKLCLKAWRMILGRDEDLLEVDLCQFFKEDFWITARKKLAFSAKGRLSIEEITVKAFRYAAKLTLDEIYSSGGLESGESIFNNNEAKEEEIFHELTLYEKNHKFCSPKDIPMHLSDGQKHIVSMCKTEADQTQLRILNFDMFGVEFLLGKVSQFCVEGIWANLNLELLYLTSDDDERFSIQHDRNLMRNILTQCASTPLGYSVYDATFKLNLFNNSLQIVT